MDWPERMADALDAARARAFSESYQCAAFAADVVKAMTDVDLLPERHESVAEAYSHIRRQGHDSIRDALASMLTEIPLALARRGDVILSDDETAIGICCGIDSAFISSTDGLAYLPTLDQAAAYRVPF